MNREEILYLVPYVISLALSAGVFIYSWMHRQVRGAGAYTWFVGGQTVSNFGFIMKLITFNLELKIFWDKFLWIVQGTVIIVAFLVFAIQYTEHKLKNPTLFWIIVLVIPTIFNLLVITDNIHHLIYPNPYLTTGNPFPNLNYDFTIVVYIFALYIYVTAFFGIGLLLRRAFQPNNLHRAQFIIIAVGFLIPVLLSMLSLFNIYISPQRDSTPFTFALSNLIVAWGVFRYRLFDIVPIARDIVVENMADPIIVVDSKNRIIDINSATTRALGIHPSNALGHAAEEVLSEWKILTRMFTGPLDLRASISLQVNERTRHYEVHISPLRDRRAELIGRVFVLNDVTERVELQSKLQELNEQLEARVQQRTEELRKSAEQYRAVVENQTEFIVRWRPNRSRTFVNDAYCRYYGITLEQAMNMDFLSTVFNEDRPAVEQKLSRLLSGISDVETETHRAVQPDKSIAWQEWTDQAIRDQNGIVIEIQSVGRDVTARKQAEESLRKSEEKFAKAFQASPDAIVLTEFESGRLVEINDGFEKLFGYRREEVIGNTSLGLNLYTNPNERERFMNILREHGQMRDEEFKVRNREGEQRTVLVSAELIEFNGIAHIVCINRDITEQKKVTDALRQSEERFSKAFQSSPNMLTILHIESVRLLEVNEAFEKITGYTRAEAIGKKTTELGLWVDTAQRDRINSIYMIDKKIQNEEIQFQTKSGNIITCNYSAELIEVNGEQCSLATIEDITERKKAEERILRLNRLYITISQINQSLVHAHDRNDLFAEICRVAIEHGNFRMAWIGLIDENDDLIKPSIFAGAELGYLENTKLNYHDPILGRGPTGTAIREGRCIICQDIANDPNMAPWRDAALSRGYGSSAAVPLRGRGRVIGALTVYASEPNGFDSEDEDLLEQIGQDVSFALDSIDAESERKRAEDELANAYDTTLEGWAKALELRDKETEGHSRRVTEMTMTLARELGVDEDHLIQIYRGAILHDIGKMAIPDEILRKADKLNEKEWEIVRKHPVIAYELLSPISYLSKALEIPYCHHEKWDGTGYPRGLKGEEIPLAARIFTIADVWDAVQSDRPYKEPWSRERTIHYLREQSSHHFDPNIVTLFLKLVEQGKI